MKKELYIIAFLALTCNVFTSCKKRFDELYMNMMERKGYAQKAIRMAC